MKKILLLSLIMLLGIVGYSQYSQSILIMKDSNSIFRKSYPKHLFVYDVQSATLYQLDTVVTGTDSLKNIVAKTTLLKGDTASYAFNSDTALHAFNADTSYNARSLGWLTKDNVRIEADTLKIDGINNAKFGYALYYNPISKEVVYGDTSSVDFGTVGWLLAGNAGYDTTTTILGSTDALPIIFYTNSTERMKIRGDGEGVEIAGKLFLTNGHKVVTSDGGFEIHDLANGMSFLITDADGSIQTYNTTSTNNAFVINSVGELYLYNSTTGNSTLQAIGGALDVYNESLGVRTLGLKDNGFFVLTNSNDSTETFSVDDVGQMYVQDGAIKTFEFSNIGVLYFRNGSTGNAELTLDNNGGIRIASDADSVTLETSGNGDFKVYNKNTGYVTLSANTANGAMYFKDATNSTIFQVFGDGANMSVADSSEQTYFSVNANDGSMYLTDTIGVYGTTILHVSRDNGLYLRDADSTVVLNVNPTNGALYFKDSSGTTIFQVFGNGSNLNFADSSDQTIFDIAGNNGTMYLYDSAGTKILDLSEYLGFYLKDNSGTTYLNVNPVTGAYYFKDTTGQTIFQFYGNGANFSATDSAGTDYFAVDGNAGSITLRDSSNALAFEVSQASGNFIIDSLNYDATQDTLLNYNPVDGKVTTILPKEVLRKISFYEDGLIDNTVDTLFSVVVADDSIVAFDIDYVASANNSDTAQIIKGVMSVIFVNIGGTITKSHVSVGQNVATLGDADMVETLGTITNGTTVYFTVKYNTSLTTGTVDMLFKYNVRKLCYQNITIY